MKFALPAFIAPDFSRAPLAAAPLAVFEPAPADGVAPDQFHATTVFPEYLHLAPDDWKLASQSRMDCVVVAGKEGDLAVKEFRNLQKGEMVACGRHENGEDGIFVHTAPFAFPAHVAEKFAFRSQLTRETSFSIDYDELYGLLDFEKQNGFIVWVLGPAVVFDHDARQALVSLIDSGFVHGLLAGNALATHDAEAALYGTALGQEIYSKRSLAQGHYKHLDALNAIRGTGSLRQAICLGLVNSGVMHALVSRSIPFVLAGSIRDDGPLPEVIADVYQAQDRMRALARKATTVIALATQLHTIATGNMVPCFTTRPDGAVRPVYFYTVDMSEFAVNKLANRGSLTARSILTNVQDFMVTVERGLRKRCLGPRAGEQQRA